MLLSIVKPNFQVNVLRDTEARALVCVQFCNNFVMITITVA